MTARGRNLRVGDRVETGSRNLQGTVDALIDPWTVRVTFDDGVTQNVRLSSLRMPTAAS